MKSQRWVKEELAIERSTILNKKTKSTILQKNIKDGK